MLRTLMSIFPRMAAGLLVLLLIACGGAEEATPTPSAPSAPTATPTIFVPQVPALPTATPTPLPGVTAVPQATATPTSLPLPGEDPQYGGVLRFASSSFPTLDPVRRAGSNWTSSGVNANFWGQLMRLGPDRVTVEADLAETWTISPDGTEWKFKIRPGVIDHEGDPFTVEDAYWQMVRYMERPNGLSAHRQTCIRSYVKPIWDENNQPLPDGGAEVTGPDELTIRLIAPGAGFVACLTGGFTVFQPSKYLKAIDTDPSGETRDLTSDEYVGTGPFKFDDMDVDNFFHLQRFDNYYREGLPYLDGLHFAVIPEQSTWEAAFSVGRIDFLGGSVGPATISVATMERMEQDMGDGVTFPHVLAMGRKVFDVNMRRPPFGPAEEPNARKLRTALQLAVNRGEINNLVFDGVGHLATEYFVGWDWIYTQQEWLDLFPGYDSSPAVKAQSVAQAKQLMEEAGYGSDNRLSIRIITAPTGADSETAQIVARQLREIYIDAEVVGLAERTEPRNRGDFDLHTDSIGAPFPDPDAFTASIHFLRGEGGRNDSGWINPQFVDLHHQQAILATNEERAPILREMAKIAHEDAWHVGWLRPTVLQGYRTFVKDYTPPPYHFINYPFEQVWLLK